ncbi:MAG: hypothetical protein ACRCVT_14555 [Leadbetterella sp.]
MKNKNNNKVIPGIILISLGVMFLFNTILDINVVGEFFRLVGKAFRYGWPLILVGIGVKMIIQGNYSKNEENDFDYTINKNMESQDS